MVIRISVPVEYRYECLGCDRNAHTFMPAMEGQMHEMAERHATESGHQTQVLQHGPGVRYAPEQVAA